MQRRLLRLRICCIPFCCLGVLLLSNTCSAAISEQDGTITDASTITPVTGGTPVSPTASLSLSSSNLLSNAVTPGETATASTNVTVSVSDVTSYSLTLSFDKTSITSGSTTITAGNAVTNNTWGYKWDNATGYSAPTTSGSTLSVPALNNSAASFTKTLAFAAKFATTAEAGHYKANGTLSLVASPKATNYTLANLAEMQQLAPGYAPDACANTVIPSGQDYAGPYRLKDVRDSRIYTIYKFKDGKCWMTENLKLANKDGGTNMYFLDGRILNSTTSDISASTWTLPASSISGFSDNAASNMYLPDGDSTGYYTWCAATAGTCASVTSNGQNAPSSICPKGWRLPTGKVTGNNTTNDFYNLFNSMDKSIFSGGTLSSTSSTNWAEPKADNLAKVTGSPYNFGLAGSAGNGSLINVSSSGVWWSSTMANSSGSYYLSLNSSSVRPGTEASSRCGGYAVRCVAQ